MKKVITFLLALALLALAACGSGQPPVYNVADGAFTCTPQELIDTINRNIDSAADANLVAIPDWPGDYTDIEIVGSTFSMSLNAAASGKLAEIQFCITSGYSSSAEYNAGFVLGVLLGLFSPSEADALAAAIEEQWNAEGDFFTNSADGVDYVTWSYGAIHNLTIKPAA